MYNDIDNTHSKLIIGYLQKSLSSQELESFYKWVNENEENKRTYFEAKTFYESNSNIHSLDINKSWQRLLDSRKAQTRIKQHSFLLRLGTYAAIATVSIVITSSIFNLNKDNQRKEMFQYIGGNALQADKVKLSDGSLITLGMNTTLTYDTYYGKKNRIVYLEGEAFFEVTKQLQKPFIVKTKGQSIKALGTKFNVSAYPTDSLIITTLEEGSVLINTEDLSLSEILEPNEQYIFNKNSNSVIRNKVDTQLHTSWTSGYYYFPNQTLETILYHLNHIYKTKFIIQSNKLKNRRFSGTFYRGQSIKEIMEIIQLSIPIQYDIENNSVTITDS